MDMDTANLVAGFFSVSIYLVVCCSVGAVRLRDAARSGHGLRDCASFVGKRFWEFGKFDPHVWSMLERERVHFAKQHAGQLAHVLAFLVLLNCLRLSARNNLVPPHHDSIPMTFVLVMCLLVQVFPQCATTRLLQSCFALVCLWPICLPLAGQDVAQNSHDWVDHSVDVFRRLCLQALLGAYAINPKVACTLVLVQGAARSATFLARGDDLPYTSPLFDVRLALVMCAWIVIAEMRFISVVRCSLETWELLELRLLCLLYALYDVVVTLDTDLRVAARAPKLDLLLNTRDAQGTHLGDFMGATDRQRFLEFVARAPPDVTKAKSNPAPAQSLNVHLQDGRGSWIQVQLFHTQFTNFGSDQVEHLVGICEVGDGGARAAGGEFGCAASGISLGRESFRAGTSVDGVSTSRAYSEQDSDCSPFAGDSASVAGARPRMARDTGADAESSIAELPEQVDVVTPLRGEAEDRPAGFSRQQSTQQPGEVSITFDTLRFTIRQNQSGNPVVDASLLTNESLQQWVAGWSSCRAWMQDFVNAILRPVSSESWPPSAGPPASASFRVAFRGSCRLPPDILTRSGVPCSPPSLPLQGGGDAASAERRHSHSPDGDVVMNHSRERVSPSPSARGHSSPLAVAPQRSPRRVSRRADPDWPGPAPAPIGAAQSWRECAESRGESGSFKDSCEGSERSVQI